MCLATTDEEPYWLQDEEAEKKWGFTMAESRTRAAAGKFLTGYKVYRTASVKPEERETAAIVRSAGGTVLPRFPSLCPSTLRLAHTRVFS